jgi:hypothetical protein
MNLDKSLVDPNLSPIQLGLEGLVDEEPKGNQAVLFKLTMADQEIFVSAMAESKQKSWLYFFPFLHSFSLAPNHSLLWERANDSICVYILRSINNIPRLRLYLPPFPFSGTALKSAEDRQRSFNGDNRLEIVWAEQSLGPELMQRGYLLRYRESEYIYDGNLVRASAGGDFERLRRYVNRARRTPELIIRNYEEGDQAACLELLSRWRRLRTEQGINIDGYGYTRRCIENALDFKNGLLRGEVIVANEKLVAFSFGGRIRLDIESIFITISNHEFPGLGYLQRHNFMSNSPNTALFNDSSDADRSGLEQVKSSFRPIEMNHLYRASSGE